MKLKLIALLAVTLLASCAHRLEDGTTSYIKAPKSWKVSANPLDFPKDPADPADYTEDFIRIATAELHAQNLKSFWHPSF